MTDIDRWAERFRFWLDAGVTYWGRDVRLLEPHDAASWGMSGPCGLPGCDGDLVVARMVVHPGGPDECVVDVCAEHVLMVEVAAAVMGAWSDLATS